MVEKRVCAVKISDLPCLASGNNSNLTSENMADLWRQVISVDNDKDPDTENIPVPGNIPLTQLEEDNGLRYEGIIFLRRLNNLHNTTAAFKNYSLEEVMKMKILGFFLYFLLTI